MAKRPLSREVLELVAGRFKALSEPARLQILQSLRSGERTVTELALDTGLGQANLSRHLRLLDALGFVSRRKEGLFAYYALADESVFRLCEIICGRLETNARTRARTLAR
jgi:DNA-binding transcriptional ArsR family regulator